MCMATEKIIGAKIENYKTFQVPIRKRNYLVPNLRK
jgi:hypothetical protein